MEMEVEGSGGSQSQLTDPAVDVDEAALAATKRARKRSRYLSPPYTDTGVQEKKVAGSHKQREEEEVPPHVSAAEVLSALRATALGQGEGMDAAALRFLTMFSRNRNRNSIFVDDHPDSHAAAGGGGGSQDDGAPSVSAAGVGRKMLNLNAGPDDGSLAKKKKNPHPPAAAAAGANANAKQQKDSAAVVLQHAITTHGHGHASQSPVFSATARHGHPNPPPVVTTETSPVNNEKKKRNKKRLKTIGQHSYVGNPVALVLDFAEGTLLPSREDLLSTFSRFGSVIDNSVTTISQDKHTARVAFATRAQAEAALTSIGGAFGPPFPVASIQDLPPITPPLPKLPLTDIRNNLGKMILSLSSKAAAAPQEANAKTAAVDSLSLVGEMQHLLAKVDKVLQVQRPSATAHHA